MSPNHRRFTLGAAVVLACAVSQPAFAAPSDLRGHAAAAANGAQQSTPAVDLRAPDSQDAHRFAPTAAVVIDRRAPDSQDAHRFAPTAAVVIDRRSPDTVDLASRGDVARTPVVTVASPQGGFDWGDAGIGAGGAVAVLLLGLGAALMATHRRRGVKPPRAVAH
jgi:hypothetical protein